MAFYSGELIERQYQNGDFSPVYDWHNTGRLIGKAIVTKALPWAKVTEAQARQVMEIILQNATMFCESQAELDEYRKHVLAGWPKMWNRIQRNPAIYYYLLDNALKSRMLWKYLQVMGRAPALENAFGEGWNNAGKYIRIPDGDRARDWSGTEPILVWVRERIHQCMEAIYRAFDLRGGPENTALASLSAGLYPVGYRYGFSLKDLQAMTVVGCDLDPDLATYRDDTYRYHHGVSFAETGIQHYVMRNEDFVTDKNNWDKFDVVEYQGGMSYLRGIDAMRWMICAMARLCRERGVIVADWQLMRATLIRCKEIGWETNPPLMPALSETKLCNQIYSVCKDFGFGLEFFRDTRNLKPVSVGALIYPRGR